ncbi:sensor histidine kinase [Nocardia sp. NPDC050406]|uniref:sensor histidine kinase n=1 Tax=Nocardia sp. NPDC050406 TaxID=3364318 RepID=UPI0037A92164
MNSHRSPAVARLRRARWLMTALVTAITATAVLVLGFVAAQVDSRGRADDVDRRVDYVSNGLARAVMLTEDYVLDLSSVTEDALLNGAESVVIMTRRPGEAWKQSHTHLRSYMPADDELAALASRVEAENDLYASYVGGGVDVNGRPVRVSATAVHWDGTDLALVMIAGASPTPYSDAHRVLVWQLAIGGTVLVLLATAAAYLLSGRSLREALRLLDEHEQFLSDAAHELRTPLTTLKLLTESRPEPTDVAHTLTEARRLADRMARLVTGLLARARAQSGIAEPERTMLRLDQLVEAVAEEAGDARITVSAHPSVVVGDPQLLSLAVRNMLENALTHGAVNRAAPVEVHIAEGRVSIRDHGPGVDPVMSANPFHRGTAGRGGRNGIGLALVAWVAQVHGGNASIEPAVGGGTIATLWLPPADMTAGARV